MISQQFGIKKPRVVTNLKDLQEEAGKGKLLVIAQPILFNPYILNKVDTGSEKAQDMQAKIGQGPDKNIKDDSVNKESSSHGGAQPPKIVKSQSENASQQSITR